MKAKLITAKEKMAEKIAKVHIDTWKNAYKGIISDEYLQSLSVKQRVQKYKFRKNLAEGQQFFALKLKREIIGLLFLIVNAGGDGKNKGEISAIYLSPAHWDKGYGSQMMEYAVDYFAKQNCDEIFIWVLEQNMRAINFYKKFGFTFDGNQKTIVLGKKLKEVRYSKKL